MAVDSFLVLWLIGMSLKVISIVFLVNNGGGQFPSPVADMSLKVINGGGQFPSPVAEISQGKYQLQSLKKS